MQCILLCGNSQLPSILRNAGPARLADELRNNGFDTICIDIGIITNFDHASLLEKIINKFVSKDTLWIGISTTFLSYIFDVPLYKIGRNGAKYDIDLSEYKLFNYFINLCKSKNSNIKFIQGGSYFINLSKYDFYQFRGYADHELIEFTKWCKDSSYKMISVNKIGKLINCNEYNNFVRSSIKWHETDFISSNDTLPIEISRGCIFKCKFCAYPLNGKQKGEWIKHKEILKNELINNYEKYGVTKYIFSDDTYNDSFDKIKDLYENVFSKLPFQLTYGSYIRLDLAYRFKETADILQKSGQKVALLGIETNNAESAKIIGKGLDFEKQIDFLKYLRQHEFKNTHVTSGFIFGLPSDTKDSMNSLESFLLSDKNPLDEWITRPLTLNPVDKSLQKTFFSEFDLEYKKYGYIPIDSVEENIFQMKWKLTGKDFDYNYCFEQTNRINKLSFNLPNMKYSAQEFFRLSTIIPEEDVFLLSKKELNSKYNIKLLVRNYIKQYYEKLLSY